MPETPTLLDQIVDTRKRPSINAGRNIAAGHLRGWALEFGGVAGTVSADPVYRKALELCQQRGSLLPEPKLQNLFLIVRYFLDGPEGDIVEFGSFRGGSAVFMGSVLRQLDRRQKVFALDSYAGMPKTDLVRDLHREGDFADTDLDEFNGFIRSHELDDTVIPVKGLFEDAFPAVAERIDRIALAHIDCDIYEAVRYSINAIKSKMSTAGYVVFDDPLHGSCLGAMQAIEEDLYHREALSAEQVYPHLVFRYPPLNQSPRSAHRFLVWLLRHL